MKKTKLLIITLAAVMSLSACGSDVDTSSVEMSEQTTTEAIADNDETAETASETKSTEEIVEPAAENFLYQDDEELGGIKITGYTGKDKAIRIPLEIDGKPVKSIELSNSTVTYVEIPEGVNDFKLDCTMLKSAKMPDSVTHIKDHAFKGCVNLESITIPESVTYIYESAFSGCGELKSVTIPDGVTNIEFAAFSYCKSLTEITIPGGVSNIGREAFSNCSNLEKVTISNGVTSIDASAFWSCASLTEISIPDSVTSIGKEAFRFCSNLASITIPDSVTSIGQNAFGDCEAITVTYKGNSYNYTNCDDLYTAANG
ncbi:MAG: leucine-rich repeat protein [Oscillospiraceae bacterium]